MNPPGPRDAADAGAAALAALAITALIEATSTSGSLALVLHPLYVATLLLSAVLAALATRRLRPLRLLHGAALVTATFALQLLLMLAWGVGASWMLVWRG